MTQTQTVESPAVAAGAQSAANELAVKTLSDQIAQERAALKTLQEQLTTTARPDQTTALAEQVDASQSRLTDLTQKLQQTVAPYTGEPARPSEYYGGPPSWAGDVAIAMFVCSAITIIGYPIARAIGAAITGRAARKGMAPELTERLSRLEQGVDAIAVEVERVSEGQRFVTRLLSEAPPDLTRLKAGTPERAAVERA